MALEVILMQDVQGIGQEGQIIKVAEGFARNYLLPRKLAAPVTDATRRQLDKRRRVREADLAQQKTAAQELAAKLEKVSVTIPVKTGEGGRLYGSVTLPDVLAALQAQGVTLEKHQLEFPQPLKELGVFPLTAKLHPEVQATVKVWIVQE